MTHFSQYVFKSPRQNPREFRATYELADAVTEQNGTKYGQIVITGPELVDTDFKSHPIEIPQIGFVNSPVAQEKTYIDPQALAFMIEKALRQKTLTIEQVIAFLSENDWHRNLKSGSEFYKKLTKENTAVKVCKGR